MSWLSVELRKLTFCSCPPLRVRPSISWELTKPPLNTWGSKRESPEVTTGSLGIMPPTLATVFDSFTLTAAVASEYSSGPSLPKVLGSRLVPARSSDESSFRPSPA
ncbi:hypothetical protein D9M68_902260 [compost metagenome]